MSGLYVHIPFCKQKCYYCDFYSVGVRNAVWDKYVDALCREAEARLGGDDIPIETVYIGGGTPSLIPSDDFEKLAAKIFQYAPCVEEFTIEVNPDDVTEEKARIWKACGVDRVSMGVQTLVDEELAMIGRRHSAGQAIKAYEILRKYFDNISLDLIFGLPGQTLESLKYTLERFIQMAPEHISAYSLMYEERTALTRMRDAGKVNVTDEVDCVKMFGEVNGILGEAGYERYELSNYARPGCRSRHNSNYWQGKSYIGLGAAAHSYDGKSERIASIADYQSYIRYWDSSAHHSQWREEAPIEIENLSEDELREEMIMTRLRTSEGLSLEEYGKRFGSAELRMLKIRARQLLDRDNPMLRLYSVRNGEEYICLSEAGIMLSDNVIVSLF